MNHSVHPLLARPQQPVCCCTSPACPALMARGDLGPAARHFVDWLAAAGQTLWQILPLSPAGPGNSPYQSVSAFAGSPLMVDLDDLVQQGWLPWMARKGFDEHRCDFERVAPWRMACLRKAWNGFHRTRQRRMPQLTWPPSASEHAPLARRLRPLHGARRALRRPLVDLAGRAGAARDRRHCRRRARGIRARAWASGASCNGASGCSGSACAAMRASTASQIVGDAPIFVAHHSADVWAHADRVPAGRRSGALRGGRRAARLLQHHRPALGQPALRLGGHGAPTATAGGKTRLAHLFSSRSTSCGWTISAASRRTGKSRPANRRPSSGQLAAPARACAMFEGLAMNWAAVAHHCRGPGPDHARGDRAARRPAAFPGMRILQFAFGSGPKQPLPAAQPGAPRAWPTPARTTTRPRWAGGTARPTGEKTAARDYLGTSIDTEPHWALVRATVACRLPTPWSCLSRMCWAWTRATA
jgi:4-alpha-glucanotransferase